MVGVLNLDEILAKALVRPIIKKGQCIYDVHNPKILKKYLNQLKDNEVICEWMYNAGGKTIFKKHPLEEAKVLYENRKEFNHPRLFHYHTKQEIKDRIKELR